jgi:hypothetical protein
MHESVTFCGVTPGRLAGANRNLEIPDAMLPHRSGMTQPSYTTIDNRLAARVTPV